VTLLLGPPYLDSAPFAGEGTTAPSVPVASSSKVVSDALKTVTAPARVADKAWTASEFDPILRSQYYADGHAPTGEQKLLFAVLEDALRCYVQSKNRGSERRDFLGAREWFNDRSTSHVFSFESVCANLDINPECLRYKLKSLGPEDFPRKHFCNRRRHRSVRPSRNRTARQGIDQFAGLNP
jgi:hypothetical protein